MRLEVVGAQIDNKGFMYSKYILQSAEDFHLTQWSAHPASHVKGPLDW